MVGRAGGSSAPGTDRRKSYWSDAMLTRREFGKYALATLPAATVVGSTGMLRALAQAKPNSLVDGVQIGAITYSFRSMPDQSAEATLQLHRRVRHQRRRDDGRTGRELCRHSDGAAARWRAGGWRWRSRTGWRRSRSWRRCGAARPRFQKAPRWATWNGQPCVIPAAGARRRWRQPWRRTWPWRRGPARN